MPKNGTKTGMKISTRADTKTNGIYQNFILWGVPRFHRNIERKPATLSAPVTADGTASDRPDTTASVLPLLGDTDLGIIWF